MPGKLATALTNLAAIAVTGVNANYDVGAAPLSLVGVTLPVLIVQPNAVKSKQQKVGKFEVSSPSGSSGVVSYDVTHVLLHSRFVAGRHPSDSPPGLDDLIDNYATAIRGNPSLSGVLYQPTVYQLVVEPIAYGKLLYYGARFFHTLVVET